MAVELIGAGPAGAADAAPVVQSVVPDIGPLAGGTSVTIGVVGANVGGATAVRFGDVPAASFTVACVSFDDPCSESEITAVSPAHAEGIVHVTVTTPGGTSTTGDCGDSGETGQSERYGPPCDKFNYYGEPRGGTWATTGVQAKGGAGQLTVLRSGKVLLTGPLGNETYDPETGRTAVSGAELYDPATGRWSSCSEAAASQDCPGPMVATRYPGHTATLLKDGRVLIAGGYDPTRSAEIYDPATGKFARAGDLSTDRDGHTATLLPDGRVLVAGGEPEADLRGGSPGNSAEIYNPATNQWTLAKPMTEGVVYHTAALLGTGKVLVAGGRIPPNSLLITSTDTSQLYDPVLDVWTRCPSEATATLACPAPLLQGRYWNPATLLADGRLLAAGGVKANGVVVRSTAELYDPGRGVWTQTGRMGQARYYHAAARLPNGKVLVAGGASRRNYHFRGGALNSAELYDPATGRWSWAPFMPEVQTGIDPEGGPVRVFETLPGVTLPTGPWAACAANCGKVLVVRSDLQSGPGERSFSGAGLRSLLFSPTPEVTAVSPAAGTSAGGSPVAITGTGLASVSSVKFGGVEAQRVEPDAENPDGKLIAIAPPHEAGPVEVIVTADGGISAAVPAARFAYLQDTVPGPGPGGGGGASGGSTAGAGGLTQGATSGTQQGGRPVSPGAPSVAERSALERCLAKAKRLAKKAKRSARRRRGCYLPGRVGRLKAKGRSASVVRLTFSAPGSASRFPPPAGRFVVKQSRRRIRTERDFRGALTLCRGVCRFAPTRVGQRIILTVTGLRPGTRYYYAVKALGASGRAGPRSKTAKATTRRQSAR